MVCCFFCLDRARLQLCWPLTKPPIGVFIIFSLPLPWDAGGVSDEVGFFWSAGFLASLLAGTVVGGLSDKYGRKRMWYGLAYILRNCLNLPRMRS